MAGKVLPLSSNEVRKFTLIVFTKILGIEVEEAKLKSNDAYKALDYLQKTTGLKVYKPALLKTLFGGKGWQGVINDVTPTAYEGIRNVINTNGNNLQVPQTNTWGKGSVSAATILRVGK